AVLPVAHQVFEPSEFFVDYIECCRNSVCIRRPPAQPQLASHRIEGFFNEPGGRCDICFSGFFRRAGSCGSKNCCQGKASSMPECVSKASQVSHQWIGCREYHAGPK